MVFVGVVLKICFFFFPGNKTTPEEEMENHKLCSKIIWWIVLNTLADYISIEVDLWQERLMNPETVALPRLPYQDSNVSHNGQYFSSGAPQRVWVRRGAISGPSNPRGLDEVNVPIEESTATNHLTEQDSLRLVATENTMQMES